jgi:hypothetical protein
VSTEDDFAGFIEDYKKDIVKESQPEPEPEPEPESEPKQKTAIRTNMHELVREVSHLNMAATDLAELTISYHPEDSPYKLDIFPKWRNIIDANSLEIRTHLEQLQEEYSNLRADQDVNFIVIYLDEEGKLKIEPDPHPPRFRLDWNEETKKGHHVKIEE